MYTDPREFEISENYWSGGGAVDFAQLPAGSTIDFSRPAHLRGEVSFADGQASIEAETRIRALNKIIVDQHEPPLHGKEVAMLTGMILADRMTTDQQLVDAVNSSRERFEPQAPAFSQPEFSGGHRWSDYRQKFAQRR
jgi:hypothetical protein